MKCFALLFAASAALAQDPQVAITRIDPVTCALLTQAAKIPCKPVLYVSSASDKGTKYFEVVLNYRDTTTGEARTTSQVTPAVTVNDLSVAVTAFDDPGGQISITVSTLSPGKRTVVQ